MENKHKRTKRTWSSREWKYVICKQKCFCNICQASLDETFEVDHIIALADGGTDCHKTNAQALCPHCHALKTKEENYKRYKKQKTERETMMKKARMQYAKKQDDDTPKYGFKNAIKALIKDNVKIQYNQTNPKKRGSNSYLRYEKYKYARTLQEAKNLGANDEDLIWDAERMFWIQSDNKSDESNNDESNNDESDNKSDNESDNKSDDESDEDDDILNDNPFLKFVYYKHRPRSFLGSCRVP